MVFKACASRCRLSPGAKSYRSCRPPRAIARAATQELSLAPLPKSYRSCRPPHSHRWLRNVFPDPEKTYRFLNIKLPVNFCKHDSEAERMIVIQQIHIFADSSWLERTASLLAVIRQRTLRQYIVLRGHVPWFVLKYRATAAAARTAKASCGSCKTQ